MQYESFAACRGFTPWAPSLRGKTLKADQGVTPERQVSADARLIPAPPQRYGGEVRRG